MFESVCLYACVPVCTCMHRFSKLCSLDNLRKLCVRSLSMYVCMIIVCTLLCAGCPDGFYGDGCQLQCTCRLPSQCMKDSGDCDCDVGYTGQSCTQSEYQWKWNSTSQVNYLTYIAGL